MGEIVRRRGRVTGQRRQGAKVAIEADMPLAATFGYVGAIRSLSSGARVRFDVAGRLRRGAAARQGSRRRPTRLRPD